MRMFPPFRAVNVWNSLLTQWMGETKPMKTKQTTDYLRWIKTLTWVNTCENQSWIWWPKGYFQACFFGKQYLNLCSLSGATEEPVFMSQDCPVLSTRYHAGFDEWLVEVSWFVSLTLWQECNPETSCTMVGNLAKIRMFIVVLTYANSLACVFTTCAVCSSLLP